MDFFCSVFPVSGAGEKQFAEASKCGQSGLPGVHGPAKTLVIDLPLRGSLRENRSNGFFRAKLPATPVPASPTRRSEPPAMSFSPAAKMPKLSDFRSTTGPQAGPKVDSDKLTKTYSKIRTRKPPEYSLCMPAPNNAQPKYPKPS